MDAKPGNRDRRQWSSRASKNSKFQKMQSELGGAARRGATRQTTDCWGMDEREREREGGRGRFPSVPLNFLILCEEARGEEQNAEEEEEEEEERRTSASVSGAKIDSS